MEQVRVRFAPSPTGPLHMGGVRTALYNYLFAKNNGGTFILRIEDTDQARFVPGAEDYIKQALRWCGFEPDEGPDKPGGCGPYRQSERKEMYRAYADQLIESGHAYIAFDTPEDLEQMRNNLKASGVASPQYNVISRESMKNSLTLPADEVQARVDAGDPYVIRIKMPRNEEIRFEDMIRGWVVVNTSNLDDKVIFKSDGMPTYHLANIVDDHLMRITHVIRGEEWLPSAPLHVKLYECFGWEMPKLAHLPLILRPDGKGKLSKRDGDRLGFPVFPLEWKDPISGEISSGYREKGFFPEAFVNMLAFLGWNPGDERELFRLEELVQEFKIERVGKSGAKFDGDKARWFNQQYLRERDATLLLTDLEPYLRDDQRAQGDDFLVEVIDMMKERSSFVQDILQGEYFFSAPTEYDEKTSQKKWKEGSADLMQGWVEELRKMDDFSEENIDAAFHTYIESKEVGLGQLLPIFRLLVTGQGMGPSMFRIAALLGQDECVSRIELGLSKLS